MKPILRDLRTGLYFQGAASWTQNPEEALVYNNLDCALEAAYSSSMDSLELNVLLLDDPRYTLRVALSAFFAKQDGAQTNSVPIRKEPWFCKLAVAGGQDRIGV